MASAALEVGWKHLFLVLTCVAVYHTDASDADGVNNVSEDFDVKPGGMVQEHEQSWGGFSCKFTYACQGGTKEQWVMSLSRAESGQEWICRVERPGGSSYLFFQQFKLSVSGVALQSAEVLGSGGAPLNSGEYAIDRATNSVSEVEGKFGSQLSMVSINGGVAKAEL